jgi:transcriptional regulator of acetoin/glycerol metabolism
MSQIADSKSRRLERRALADRAWQQFVSGGLEPKGIREIILGSWRRAFGSYRIDPASCRPSLVVAPEALEERCAQDEWLGLALPVLRAFTRRFRLFDHVLAYFDGQGWMLSLEGDRRVAERLAEIGFCPGTSWSEESAGTNGPGTALALGRPVEVFASEHFVSAWQAWSCAAAPIRIPGGRAPVGLVDMTGPWEVRRRQALACVSAVSRAIEERLRAAWSVREEVVRYAFRAARGSSDVLVGVDRHGRVIAANDAASRRRVLDDSSALPPAIRDEVVKALRSPSPRSDGEVRFASAEGAPVVVSIIRYESTCVGAVVRVGAPRGGARRPGANGRPAARYDFGCILGQSEPLRRAVELATTAAGNELPVVLTGESGTGKELFAHAIHAASSRGAGPFIAVNCGSIPAQILEAELFGYEPGTFTGARTEGNAGRFEDADGGTLFLDEVSELSFPAQTALLRILQEREVVRLGGSTPRSVDVRVVAATNRPLDEKVHAKGFRSDLYYRLNVFSIRVPSLRERGDDIPFLARVFLAEAEAEANGERRGLALADDAIEALRTHPWPGNVRELKNVILRAAAIAPRPRIAAQDLLLEPAVSSAASHGGAPAGGTGSGSARELERDALLMALDTHEWNFKRSARALGISRMTLYRWVHKHGISRSGR